MTEWNHQEPEPTLEEKKMAIAAWMGKKLFTTAGVDYVLEKREYDPNSLNDNLIEVEDTYVKFYPEKGGKDLTEVLANLNLKEESLVWKHLCMKIKDYTPLSIEKWFQNDDNAKTILEAVFEVIPKEKK